ncbi:MAG: hypothetical protein AAF320_00515 [Myxococcota bacterium]
MTKQVWLATGLLGLGMFVAACGNNDSTQSSSSTSEDGELIAFTVSGKCDAWNRQMGETICATNLENTTGATRQACEKVIGLAILKHTKRVKNNICAITENLLGQQDCETGGARLKSTNSFTQLCKNEKAVNCIAWQDDLIARLQKANFSCSDSTRDSFNKTKLQELHKHCTEAIGTFLPLSSDERSKDTLCNIFAGATRTGEVFTSNSAVVLNSLEATCTKHSSNFEKAVFYSFTKTCLGSNGFKAEALSEGTLFNILSQLPKFQ